MAKHWCCVPGCHSDARKAVSKYPFMKNITFIPFPTKKSNSILRRKWLNLIRRPLAYEPETWHRVCSRHFDAGMEVPTLFPWNSYGCTYTPSRSGASILKRKNHLDEVVTKTQSKRKLAVRLEEQFITDSIDWPAKEEILQSFQVPLFAKEVEVNASVASSNSPATHHCKIGKFSEDHPYFKKPYSEIETATISTQTILTGSDIEKTEELTSTLESELRDNATLLRSRFISKVTSSNDSCRFYTGIPSLVMLYGLLNMLSTFLPNMKYWSGKKSCGAKRYQEQNTSKPGPKRKLSVLEEFIITLIRFRLGLPNLLLAHIFGVSSSRISQIFTTWISLMGVVFQPLILWPSRQLTNKHMPKIFKKNFPRTRAIIDCTEMFIQKPRKPTAQSTTYSTYKSHNTFKSLVSITPTGAFNFVSKLWGGNVSDKYITQHSGFLDKVSPGDEIMADRGFIIKDLLTERRAYLSIPPFTRKCSWGKGKRLNASEIQKTRKIANCRIHVERAIERLKQFRLLSNIMPWTLKPLADSMMIVGAFICNLLKPLVKDKTE